MSICVDKIVKKIDTLAEIISEDLAKSTSLISGDYGRLLFLFEYANFKKSYNTNFLQEALQKTVNLSIGNPNLISLSHGLSGMGWFLQYLKDKNYLEDSIDSLLNEVDEHLYPPLIAMLKENEHDLLHGGIGVAVYFSNRLNENKNIEKYLIDATKQLVEIACKKDNYYFWIENPSEYYSENTILLGLAHGLASKILFFTSMHERNISRELCKTTILKVVNYLLDIKLDGHISFSTSVINGKCDVESRLAWCHGDLGIGYSFIRAGLELQDKSIYHQGLEICLKTTSRFTSKQTGVADMGFCHGMAGLTHLYRKIFDLTGDERFDDSADYWLNQLLRHLNAGENSYKIWNNANEEWVLDTGLLNGLSGVGLVLLDHISDLPEWDFIFLQKS